MSQRCVTPQQAEDLSGMPNYSNAATRTGAVSADDVSVPYMRLLEEQKKHFAEVERVSALIDDLDVGDISAQNRVALENAGVKHVTQQMLKWMDSARAANERDKLYNFQEVKNRLEGATVEHQSWWANVARKVTGLLTNDKADMIGYLQKYQGVEGRHVDMHPVVEAMNLARADYAGVMSQIQKYLDDSFGRDARLLKMAKDSGNDLEVLLDAGGHYANMEHALDRNKYGYERLKARLEEIERKKLVVTEKKDWDALEKERKVVEKHINDYEQFSESDSKPPTVHMPSGYTNAEARWGLENYHKAFGVEQADMQYITAKMRDFSNFVEGLLADNGILTPEQIAVLGTLPSTFSKTYVPMRTRKFNQSGALNDSDVYTSRSYRAFDGMTTKPDSAWATLQFFAHRAAKDIGYKAFGQTLWATYTQAMKRRGGSLNGPTDFRVGGVYDGMQVHRYDQLLARIMSGDTSEASVRARIMLNTKEGGGGIVTTVPITDKTGKTRMERVLINFDPHWEDANLGIKGSHLNKALSVDEIQKDSQRMAMQIATAVTSSYGQMFTRFTPAFAPVNGMRDVAERFVNMLSRDYIDENGQMVKGWTLAPKYAANTGRAFNALYDIVSKNIDPESPMGKLWTEYVNSGLYMNPSRHVGLENQPSKFNPNTGKVERRFVDNLLDAAGGSGRKVLGVIDGWNDWYNNIASFAHYMTLREANVPQRRAANGVLEMMNLYNKGKSTDIARMLYPFVKPTLQSGVALMRTLGLSPNAKGKFQPNLRGAATFVGLYVLASQLYAGIHRSLGRDEEGNWRADTLSLSQLQSYWPIPVGDDGEFIKIANGFGLIQAAITAAVGMDRVQRGLMEPQDLAFDMLFAVGKNVVPGNFPEFNMSTKPTEWWLRLISPTIATPAIELATNTNYLGGDIFYRKDNWTSRADSGLATTQKNYHAFAKLVHGISGGIVDLAPEQYRAILNSLMIGPLRFITAAVDSGKIGVESGEFRRKDTLRTTAVEDVGPWLSAMGMTRFWGKTGDTNRSLFYQALNAMQARAKRDGVDMSSHGATSKEEGDNLRRQALRSAGWDANDIEDAIMLWRAERELRQVARDFSGEFQDVWNGAATSDDVKPILDKFAEDRIAIFRRVVQSLRYYQTTREQ